MYEDFPYTNLHQLNLDWLVDVVQTLHDNMVISVNGQTGEVVLYKDATVQLPNVDDRAWTIIRNAHGVKRGIKFDQDGTAYIVSGNSLASVFTPENPPTSSQVISDQYIRLTTLTGEQLHNWNIFRTLNDVSTGIEFDDTGDAYIISGSNRYKLYSTKNPITGGVSSVNGQTGDVVLYTDSNGELTLPGVTNPNIDAWSIGRTINGTDCRIYIYDDGQVTIVAGSDEYRLVNSEELEEKFDNNFRDVSYTVLNGYASNNATASRPGNSPFIPRPFINNAIITGLTIKIDTAGVLSFGYYDSDEVYNNSEFDPDKVIVLEEYTFTQTGEQTITFRNPLKIPNNKAFCIGKNTDTAKLLDGANGAVKGFFYRATSTGFTFKNSNSSLGVTIYGTKQDIISTQKGKRISIYGDSISTYTGWIPAGNATFYTGSNCNVTSVNDTWWKKIIDALEYDLLVNNSWSGRAVMADQDGVTDAGYREANVLQLKNGNILPEVIIVKLGINDFDREYTLGNYDGSTALPAEPTTFTNAYAIMLDRIMTNFPQAKVYCCTLTAAEKNGTTGFPEINGNGDSLSEWNDAIVKLARAFGAEVLNHNSCGITYYNMSVYMGDWNASAQTALHPNALGHSLLANKTIEQIDNAVRLRY